LPLLTPFLAFGQHGEIMMHGTMSRKKWWGISVLAAVAVLSWTASGADGQKPRIVIVATGGTIAGAAESTTAAGYKSGAVAVDVLINAVPQLAAEVNRLLAQPDVDGVAITHGTDTMEETAYFLNLVVKSDKPVVLTGSMRPSTSLSADGPLNIYNAVGVASDRRAKGLGVLVVANDDIHGARAITKRHTTDVETFVSPEVGLVGVCLFDDREFSRSPTRAHTTATPFTVTEGQALPRVDVIYAHAGMSPDLIDAAVANGAKGLVIAGVGDGNMTTPALDAVKRSIAKGVVVVRSTRVGDGIVRRNIEVDDDKVGTVVSKELNPAKSRVLLKLSLAQTADARKVQEAFDKF
jgi:L-asparaginase